MQLAKVSERGSRHLRGLTPTDREDVIAAAVLHCWENRTTFDQHVQPLDEWFATRLKAARRQLINSQKNYVKLLNDVIDTERGGNEAEMHIAAEEFMQELNPDARQAIGMLAAGYSVRIVATEMPQLSRTTVKSLHRKMKELQDIIIVSRFYPGSAAPREYTPTQGAGIDHAIEALLRGPRPGKECPPCWRCSWYYGYLPNSEHFKPAAHADPEIRLAMRNLENRKIEIANELRSKHEVAFDFPYEGSHDENQEA